MNLAGRCMSGKKIVSTTTTEEKQVQEAYAKSFTYICEYITKQIIENSNVERMTMIKRYLQYIKSHYPDFYNPNYKTYKLKAKLWKHFGGRIQFWQPNYKSELVYPNELPKGAAVETAFEVACSEEGRLKEAAFMLRRLILDFFNDSQPLPWPPSSAYLLSKQSELPSLLIHFIMSYLLSGN
ncbi:hypothetical protein ElyMa_004422200 [Elysia marginata]|uniref:Uncharacterized protein n=1 Tax=Elysia marginata TaxID=1093978 RepID=A0AAV4HCJ9_9GAST|nr:hypothetical protein ElyMa_004422200 [Elysia marginata]